MKLLPKVKDAMDFCPTMGMKYMGDKKKKQDICRAPAGALQISVDEGRQ